MTHRTILKAEQAPRSRVMLGATPQQAQATPVEPGIWIGRAELDAMREHCLAQGWERGMADGRQQAQQEVRARAEREARLHFEQELRARQDKLAREQAEKWRGLAAALAEQMQALRVGLEAELTEWAFIAVARLLGRRAPEDVAGAVRQVLAEARLDGPLTVLLHPQDLAGVELAHAADTEAWPARMQFAADERVQLGGCLVQSPVQTLDARLEVQLALLRDSLNAARLQRVEGETAS